MAQLVADGANEVQLRGIFSHRTVGVFFFSLFNGFMDSDCAPGFDQLSHKCAQWSKRSVGKCVQTQLY